MAKRRQKGKAGLDPTALPPPFLIIPKPWCPRLILDKGISVFT